MRRVRSQFLQSVVRLLSAVGGRGVSGAAAVAPSFQGTGAPTVVASDDVHTDAGASAASLGQAVGGCCEPVRADGDLPKGAARLRNGAYGPFTRLRLAHNRPYGPTRRKFFACVGLLVASGALALPASASAAPFANLGSFGSPNGAAGDQLVFPRGVAANQSGNGAPAGSVYVAEANPNHRISQFTADGEFVRAWGFDVIVATRPDSSVPPNSNGTGFEVCDVTNGNAPADCKAGVAGGAAGQLANPLGIAIDQSSGYLYVPGTGNRRVDVFSGSGEFAGAFGWDVVPGAPAELEVCTTSCQAASAGADAGRLGALAVSAPAVDPSTPGRVYVPDTGNLRVAQYSTTISGSGVLTAAVFDKAFGWDVIPGGAAALESCTTATTCQESQPTTGGNNPGQFTSGGSPGAVAVDSTGSIYVTSGPLSFGTCSEVTPCRIQKFAPDASSVTDFGPVAGPGQLTFTSGTATTVAAVNVAVDPSNDHVFVQRRESSTSYRVLEYDSDGNYLETHPGGAALPTVATNNNQPGLAVGTAGRVYAMLGAPAASGQSSVFILGPVDPPTVTIDPVSNVGTSSATFSGTVEIPAPGAPVFDTKYRFEYSSNGVDWTGVPAADANVADGSTGVHVVSQDVEGLDPNTLYAVRLVATTGGSVTSSTVSFTTGATPPRVEMTYVEEVTQTQAQFGAHVDPEGLDTTYRFEWGDAPCSDVPNPCTGVPAFERELGDGNKALIAKEQISGLEAATSYHYRVVATNSEDTTYGPDQTFETLNHCGLTDGRCYELVSPADKGPVGAGGDAAVLGKPLQFQVASDSPEIAYNMAYGAEDATSAGEVLYKAARGPASWSSFQLDPSARTVTAGGDASVMSNPLALSRDLGCGFYSSPQPLTPDAPQEMVDAGAAILYRLNADRTWTLVTDVPAIQPTSTDWTEQYMVLATSDDCERVVFMTPYSYPGVPGQGSGHRIYTWSDGVLSPVGLVPGPSGDVYVAATPGAISPSDIRTVGNYANAVSDDMERIVFSAARQASPKPEEVGRTGVFVSENGGVGIDATRSQTGVPNDRGSRYEDASPDGGEIFFTARYGLAANGTSTTSVPDLSCVIGTHSEQVNGVGCDLYRYSVEDGTLTDLSVPGDGSNPRGASVAGVIAVSDDGSRVYFAARGQLIPGVGKTEAQNLAENTYSIYLNDGGDLRYIGPLGGGVITRFALVYSRTSYNGAGWTSQVTSDGGRLLFLSDENVTSLDAQGRPEAYLYDAQADRTVCVSCRRDRQPSVADGMPLPDPNSVANRNAPVPTFTEDGRRVYFLSRNRLATGAVNGQDNLYQWEEGQVSFIGNSSPNTTSRSLRFAGASATGDDVYFTTVDQYTWQDVDGRLDVYDARVGGGIPQPPPAPDPCDPLSDTACQDPGASPSGSPDRETETTSPDQAGTQPRTRLSVAALTRVQRARLAAGRSVRVRVRVNRAGTVAVRGVAVIAGLRARVLSGSMQVPRAGRYSIPVSLSRAARTRIRRAGTLRVVLTVRLAGADGADARRRLTLPRGRTAGSRATTTDGRAGK